jgi:hypothetical protein
MRRIDPRKLFAPFGIDFYDEVRRAKSEQQVASILEELRARAKKRYRELMFEHHPDRGGDEEKAKYFTELYDAISKLKFVPPRPIPSMRVVFYSMSNPYTTTTTSTGTSTSYGFW